MIHLPGHVCPACGGPHRPNRAELPAAAEVRPYFATYTPSKFPRALSVTDSGALYRDTDCASWTSIGQVTIPYSGLYDVVFKGHQNHFANNGSGQCRMYRSDGTTLDSGSGGSGFDSTSTGLYWQGPCAATQIVYLQVIIANQGYSGYFSGNLYAIFIPTPANPQ